MVKRLRINVVSLLKNLELVIKIMVNTQIISRYRSVYRGKGLEFEDFRIYTPLDDAKRIDWKASMRTNDLLIRLYKEERELNVYILLDTSSSMIFGSTEKLKMEYAAEIAAAFGYIILEAGDKVGLVMFNDKISKTLPLSSGRKQFLLLLKALTNPEFYGGGYDIEKAINFVMKTSRGRGLLIIISDFIGIGSDFKKIISRAAVKFDVIGVMVRDPRDEFMPDEDMQVVTEHPYANDMLLIDTKKIKKSYEDFVRVEEDKLEHIFLNSNCDLLKLSTAEPFTKPVLEFFIKRRERISM
ncbi:MAG: DUF58 domain-containing protein [Candidatus Aenigmarchaeota archaeon]|nr:DUF58 domain-containing protein [Candidatus Aenigmarchaeota archaeon]